MTTVTLCQFVYNESCCSFICTTVKKTGSFFLGEDPSMCNKETWLQILIPAEDYYSLSHLLVVLIREEEVSNIICCRFDRKPASMYLWHIIIMIVEHFFKCHISREYLFVYLSQDLFLTQITGKQGSGAKRRDDAKLNLDDTIWVLISFLTPSKDIRVICLTWFTDLFSILDYWRCKSYFFDRHCVRPNQYFGRRGWRTLWCWMNKWWYKSMNIGKGNARFKL